MCCSCSLSPFPSPYVWIFNNGVYGESNSLYVHLLHVHLLKHIFSNQLFSTIPQFCPNCVVDKSSLGIRGNFIHSPSVSRSRATTLPEREKMSQTKLQLSALRLAPEPKVWLQSDTTNITPILKQFHDFAQNLAQIALWTNVV